MKRQPRSPAQRERQDSRHRDRGKYAQVNPCQGCGKSAGIEYFSHPLTDSEGSDGESWHDAAICLCKLCAKKTASMTTVQQFLDFAKKNGVG